MASTPGSRESRAEPTPEVLRERIARTRAALARKVERITSLIREPTEQSTNEGDAMASTKSSKQKGPPKKGKGTPTKKKSTSKKAAAKSARSTAARAGKAKGGKRSAARPKAAGKRGKGKSAKVLGAAKRVVGKALTTAAAAAVEGALEGAAQAVREEEGKGGANQG